VLSVRNESPDRERAGHAARPIEIAMITSRTGMDAANAVIRMSKTRSPRADVTKERALRESVAEFPER
jgi:hypothetical protein